MKNLKKLLVINLMLLTIISCSKDDDPIPDNTSLDAPTIGTAMAGDAPDKRPINTNGERSLSFMPTFLNTIE